jgi:PAS domain S-box-containing protein
VSRPLSEKHFRALIENSADGIALLAADSSVLYASPPTTLILGYQADEMVGRQALEPVHPDDLAAVRAMCVQLRKTAGASLVSQFRYRHKEGSWRWLEGTAKNLLAEPGVEAVVVNYRDITERRIAEEEREQYLARELAARATAETAAERLRAIQTITDAALGYLALDDSLRELLGRTRTVLAGDSAAILLLTDDNRHLTFRTAQGLEAGTPPQGMIPLESSIVGKIAEQRKPLIVEDLTQIEGVIPVLRKNVRSLIGAPLLSQEEVIGMVFVGTFSRCRFSEEDLRLLQVVADRAATVIEHARLFEQVRAGRERAQLLSQQLMEAQEAERRRLARELHDEIGQALTAVKLNLQGVQRAAGDPAAMPRLEESLAIVDRALQQVRNLSLDLRPSLLDDLGLVAALRWYVDRVAQRAGFTAEFIAEPPGIRAPASLETTCFRVAQEALTNVVRHARAQRVRVELRSADGELHLRVRDDGAGFDVAEARQRAVRGGSLGLLGMQERVALIRGRIKIHSASGKGAEVHVSLPLAPQPSLERRSKKRASP